MVLRQGRRSPGLYLGAAIIFNIYQYIVNEIQASVRLFADDTILYIIVENPYAAAITLNNDLYYITSWASDWLVNFNAAKTLSMLLTLKHFSPYHTPLFMNGIAITENTSNKHLGLTLSNNCSWNEHINNITSTACTRLNLNRDALEKIYNSFIRDLY